MIVNTSSDLFGGMCTIIQAPGFTCSVSTAKEGFFKGLSTIVVQGAGSQAALHQARTLRGKILYKDSAHKSERRRCHGVIAGLIDRAGDEGISLIDAIVLAFEAIEQQGVIAEAGVGEHGFAGPFYDLGAVLAKKREVESEKQKWSEKENDAETNLEYSLPEGLTERERLVVLMNGKMLQAAIECAKSLAEGNEITGYGHFRVILEFLYVFHNLLYRTLRMSLNQEASDEIMGEMLPGISSAVETLLKQMGADDETIRKSAEEVVADYAQSVQAYSSCKLTADKDAGLAGTLFWEFGKNIARLAEKEMDIAVITHASTLSGTVFHSLGMKEFCEKFAS